jgi:hypothetical protein
VVVRSGIRHPLGIAVGRYGASVVGCVVWIMDCVSLVLGRNRCNGVENGVVWG